MKMFVLNNLAYPTHMHRYYPVRMMLYWVMIKIDTFNTKAKILYTLKTFIEVVVMCFFLSKSVSLYLM